MDQREIVRQGQNGTAEKFSIILVSNLEDIDKLLPEAGEFSSIVQDWYRVRSNTAERVCLVAVADPRYHNAIKEFIEGVHAFEVNVRHIFQSIPLELSLYDPQLKLVSKHEFIPGQEAVDGSFSKKIEALLNA